MFSTNVNYISYRNIYKLIVSFWDKSLTYWNFISNYYLRNELIWQDGFLFDFLQKKTLDMWMRKFLIFTGFLFSERLVFESVVRLYLDNLIWTLHNSQSFEYTNIAEVLNNIIFILVSMFIFVLSFTLFF